MRYVVYLWWRMRLRVDLNLYAFRRPVLAGFGLWLVLVAVIATLVSLRIPS